MVDISSHRIVDMIDSRDYVDVKKWLQTYPNLRIISRDGSNTYHNAITDAHPEALQVSDRFHLLKNLTSYAQDYLKKELKQKIAIPVTDAAVSDPRSLPASQADGNRTLTLKEKYDQAQQLAALGYAKTRICKSLNNGYPGIRKADIRFA
jgi:transposase